MFPLLHTLEPLEAWAAAQCIETAEMTTAKMIERALFFMSFSFLGFLSAVPLCNSCHSRPFSHRYGENAGGEGAIASEIESALGQGRFNDCGCCRIPACAPQDSRYDHGPNWESRFARREKGMPLRAERREWREAPNERPARQRCAGLLGGHSPCCLRRRQRVAWSMPRMAAASRREPAWARTRRMCSCSIWERGGRSPSCSSPAVLVSPAAGDLGAADSGVLAAADRAGVAGGADAG